MTIKLRIKKRSLSQQINLLCVFFWFSLIVTDIVRRIPRFSSATNLIRNLVYLVVFGFVFIKVLSKRDNYKYYFVPGIIYILLFGVSCLFHPEILSIASNDVLLFFIRCLIGFCLGACITDWRDLIDQISSCHWISLAYAIIILTTRTNTLADTTNYMSFSYALLVPATITFFSGMENKQIVKVVSSTVQLFVIAVIGARGPVLCFMVSLTAIIMIKLFTNKTKLSTKILVTVLLLVSIIIVTLWYDDIMLLLYSMFPNSRTLILFSQGTLLESSDRESIYEPIIQEIMKNPILPNGLFYDRIYLSKIGTRYISTGSYPHNFVLEIWFQLGAFGLFFIIYYFHKTIELIYRVIQLNNSYINIAFSVFCLAICCKMMISSTYLSDAQMWFSLGAMISFSTVIRSTDGEIIQ